MSKGGTFQSKYKLLAQDLILGHYSIERQLDFAFDCLFTLEEKYLQRELRIHDYYKKYKPEKADEQEERCIQLQDAITGSLYMGTIIQKYYPELITLEKVKKIATDFFVEMPHWYNVVFRYDTSNPNGNPKFEAEIERRNYGL